MDSGKASVEIWFRPKLGPASVKLRDLTPRLARCDRFRVLHASGWTLVDAKA